MQNYADKKDYGTFKIRWYDRERQGMNDKGESNEKSHAKESDFMLS